jgi:hypothetical protein
MQRARWFLHGPASATCTLRVWVEFGKHVSRTSVLLAELQARLIGVAAAQEA